MVVHTHTGWQKDVSGRLLPSEDRGEGAITAIVLCKGGQQAAPLRSMLAVRTAHPPHAGASRRGACRWAVHDSFEGASQPHLQRGPRGDLVDNQQSSLRPRCKAAHTCERTRAGGVRVRGTARERAVACGASAHTHPPRPTLTRACRAWNGASGRPSPACLAYVSNLHPQEENQRTMTRVATMATMATPS